MKIDQIYETTKTKNFMDEEELHLTDLCHIPSINHIRQLLKDLCVKKFDRAIDVGCGDARLALHYLIE